MTHKNLFKLKNCLIQKTIHIGDEISNRNLEKIIFWIKFWLKNYLRR